MIEPNADMRQMAAGLMQMYQALVQAGFSEPQAMAMLGTVIASSVYKQQGDE